MRKISTCIGLEPQTKQMVDRRGINLSEFVETALQSIFETSEVQALKEKLTRLDMERAGLMSQLKSLEAAEKLETEKIAISGAIMMKLKESYLETFLRSDGCVNESEWASRPKILALIRETKKSKVAICLELHDWALKEAKRHEV
jgi:hypothetical protein